MPRDPLSCRLITLVTSLQMNSLPHHPLLISSCKVPRPGPWKCTHRDQLNKDIVPCLCQVFLPRSLFAGIVTKHLQERQSTQVKQRQNPTENLLHENWNCSKPHKVPKGRTGKAVAGGKMTTISFYKCQKQSSEFSVSCSIA